MRGLAAAGLAAAALAVAGCGAGDPVEQVPGASGGQAPTLDTGPLEPLAPVPTTPDDTATGAGTPTAQAPPSSAPVPSTVTVPGTAGGAQAPGDDTATTGGAAAKDRDAATFTIDPSGELGPSGVPVAAGVPVTLTLRNDDDVAHRVTVLIQNRPERELAPGASATVKLIQLAPGSYTMLLDGGGSAAVLIAGADQGP